MTVKCYAGIKWMFSFKIIKLDIFTGLSLYFTTLFRSERVAKTQHQIKLELNQLTPISSIMKLNCPFVDPSTFSFPLFLATLPFLALFLVVSRLSFAYFFLVFSFLFSRCSLFVTSLHFSSSLLFSFFFFFLSFLLSI